ncbi:MAG: EI24 domain-containing protein [Actinobacteria bacterium]|nr:EI24 domain-containing protein [Actinomycetota bacterium]
MLLAGFGWWRRRPGLMMLGLAPAAIVGAALASGIVVLATHLDVLTDAATPFADSWPGLWATLLRIAVGTAMVGGALVLTAALFTALTLLIGEPFYDRIWRAVERDLEGTVPEARYGFWRAIGDAASLITRGVLVALAAALIGFIPAVGALLSVTFGVTVTGWLLADELSSRALAARSISAPHRTALRRAHRARALGFGVATQLCFMIPLGAVLTMPAAVAGSTVLARSLLEDEKPTRTQ